jgi:hypothetical protein
MPGAKRQKGLEKDESGRNDASLMGKRTWRSLLAKSTDERLYQAALRSAA